MIAPFGSDSPRSEVNAEAEEKADGSADHGFLRRLQAIRGLDVQILPKHMVFTP
jgi:hypothetical protein